MASDPRKSVVAVSHACVLNVNRTVYRHLAGEGWDVELVTAEEIPRDKFPLKAEPQDERGPRTHFLRLSGANPRTYDFVGLEKLLEELRPDILFVEVDPISRLAVKAGGWANRAGIPFACMTCENLQLNLGAILGREGVRGIPVGLIKNVVSWTSRRLVDHVFTTSNDGVEVFRRLGFRSVSKIPIGFDQEFFHIDHAVRDKVRSELSLDHLTFAYFGRCVPEKGIHLLLDALARFKEYSWHLILNRFEAADEYSKQIESQIERLEISPRIRFVDSRHGEVSRFMNASDVVVVPSMATRKWKEQFGRVAPEAMACGNLVITSDSGALPELVGDSGLTFAEGNISSLESALKQVFERPDLAKQLGGECEIRARDHLSVEVQARLVSQKLNSLLYPSANS